MNILWWPRHGFIRITFLSLNSVGLIIRKLNKVKFDLVSTRRIAVTIHCKKWLNMSICFGTWYSMFWGHSYTAVLHHDVSRTDVHYICSFKISRTFCFQRTGCVQRKLEKYIHMSKAVYDTPLLLGLPTGQLLISIDFFFKQVIGVWLKLTRSIYKCWTFRIDRPRVWVVLP